MMDSHEINQLPRTATNNGGGGVRRRPPAAAGGGASSSYGTNEEDALLSSQNEEGYGPVLQQSYARRRSSGGGGGHNNYYNALPWYRQPQKLILVATFAWVGGVMYLASLAHAILRTHKETNNIMGISSMVENNDDFKGWLEARGMLKNAKTNNKKYGDSSSDSATNKATDEDVIRFLETYNSQSYKAKYGAASSGASSDADFQEWLGSQSQQQTNNNNKYGSSATNQHKKYGSSAETNADFKEWLDSTRRQTGSNKYGSSAGGSASAVDSELGDAWQDWLSYLSRENNNNGYGAADSGNNKASGDDNNVNVRFGSTTNNNNGANAPQEWLDYQTMNKDAKYNANGMYGDANTNLAASLAETKALASAEQGQGEQEQPVVSSSTSVDSIVSTIDWPLQGMPHQSCTASNGCSPSTNVTVLIVYGPEYHTHISEMAWNVATGVHAAFASHIQHHPSSPLHGHIIFGHTGNLTFLDVMDADAVIIGSPVYNGNVHPDIQNWINYWHIDADLSNKFGGAFATAGGIHAGADGTIMSILRSMMVFQMMAVGGDSWTSPFGAVATMYEDPFGDTQRTEYFQDSCYYTADAGRTGDHLVHPYFLRKAYGLGERIGNTTVAWKNSSYVRW